MRTLIDAAYDQALALLRAHRPQLDTLAEALLDRETLDEPDAYTAAGLPQPHPRQTSSP